MAKTVIILLSMYIGSSFLTAKMPEVLFKPELGTVYNYLITDKQEYTNYIGKSSVVFENQQKTDLTFEVDTRSKNGYGIGATINSFEIKKLRFKDKQEDAWEEDSSEHKNKFSSNLNGSKFKFKTTNNGEVYDIQGFEKIKQDLSEAYEKRIDYQHGNIHTIDSAYTSDFFKNLFNDCLNWLPDEPTVLGRKWTHNFLIQFNTPVLIKTTYTFKKVSNSVAIIEVTANETLNLGSFKNAKLRVAGLANLDLQTGMLIDCEINTNISGVDSLKTTPLKYNIHRTKTVQSMKSV